MDIASDEAHYLSNAPQVDIAMNALTVRLPDEVADRLEALASRLDRSSAHVAAQAIGEYVDRQAWQVAEIEAALQEAGRGEFATEAEVAAVLEKHGSEAE
jgi:predicted transcriptional regulator